jgi:outer membrane protein assembly factor BamB
MSESSRCVVVAFSGRVFGLDPASGAIVWEHEIDTAGNATALAITETHVYAASFRELTCFRYPSGELAWTVSTTKIGRTTLLLEDDKLLVAKAGEVECFTLDGKQLWHNRFKGKGIGYVSIGVPGNVMQADESS